MSASEHPRQQTGPGGCAEPPALGVSVSPGNGWGSGFRAPSSQRALPNASSQNGAPGPLLGAHPAGGQAGLLGLALTWPPCQMEPPMPRTRACLGAGQSLEEEGGASGGEWRERRERGGGTLEECQGRPLWS